LAKVATEPKLFAIWNVEITQRSMRFRTCQRSRMPSDILYEIGRDNSESVTFSQNGLQEVWSLSVLAMVSSNCSRKGASVHIS
jgi:hypothetical protein